MDLATVPTAAATFLPAPLPSPIVIVGLGNEIARDDAVGITAARVLESLLADREDVEVVALPWAGLCLLDVLAGRRRAILLDSLVSNELPPGRVVELGLDDLRGAVRLVSFHDLDLANLLGLGRRLGTPLPEQISIWGVTIAPPDGFGDSLSPPVAAALDPLLDAVLEEVAP